MAKILEGSAEAAALFNRLDAAAKQELHAKDNLNRLINGLATLATDADKLAQVEKITAWVQVKAEAEQEMAAAEALLDENGLITY